VADVDNSAASGETPLAEQNVCLNQNGSFPASSNRTRADREEMDENSSKREF
jgi:hypothetical protein